MLGVQQAGRMRTRWEPAAGGGGVLWLAMRPVTENSYRRLSWPAQAAHDRHVRQLTWAACANRVPQLARFSVTVEPLKKDRRNMPDVGACAPTVKAAIDGMVDGGLAEDDDPARLVGLCYLPARIVGEDGLTLTVTPAPVMERPQ